MHSWSSWGRPDISTAARVVEAAARSARRYLVGRILCVVCVVFVMCVVRVIVYHLFEVFGAS